MKLFNFFKGLSLIFIFIIIFNFVQFLSYPDDIGYDNTLTFEQLEKNSLDIIFLGSSHAYYAFSPEVIDYNTYSNSYVYATPGSTIEHSYYQLKNILKSQSPQIVVLELFTLADLRNDNVKLHKSIDTLPLNKDKVEAVIKNIDPEDDDKLNFYFPLRLYHSEWKEDNIMDKIASRLRLNYEKNITGFNFTTDILDIEDKDVLDINVKTDIITNLPPERKVVIEDIITLCNDNNINLIFTVTPYINQVDFPPVEIRKILNSMETLILENNISVIDYNLLYEELSISKLDLYDEGHVNVFGAMKISNYFSDFVNSNELLINAKDKNFIKNVAVNKNIKIRYNDFMKKYNEAEENILATQ